MNLQLVCFSVTLLALAPTSQAALLNHWTFDETSGLVAADTAGLVANNGTWQNSGSEGLSWTSGMIGGAASLTGDNGSDRTFLIDNGGGSSIEIENTTTLSISVWVQPTSRKTAPRPEFSTPEIA